MKPSKRLAGFIAAAKANYNKRKALKEHEE
jgi:hypothetical protein